MSGSYQVTSDQPTSSTGGRQLSNEASQRAGASVSELTGPLQGDTPGTQVNTTPGLLPSVRNARRSSRRLSASNGHRRQRPADRVDEERAWTGGCRRRAFQPRWSCLERAAVVRRVAQHGDHRVLGHAIAWLQVCQYGIGRVRWQSCPGPRTTDRRTIWSKGGRPRGRDDRRSKGWGGGNRLEDHLVVGAGLSPCATCTNIS